LAALNSKRVIAGILLLLVWIVIIAVHDIPLSAQGWASLVPLRCPLDWVLDIPCPTCGLGRSLVAAALGHERESFHYHPLGLPIFWGSQGLLLCWMIWPRAWESLRRMGQGLYRKQSLLWILIVLYSLWGFCWRTPL
jgi:hypothetical protein